MPTGTYNADLVVPLSAAMRQTLGALAGGVRGEGALRLR